MSTYRFAPSNTGKLTVGNTRTALTSYILAKQAKGTCLLRIEDTDIARSSDAWTKNIMNSFEWLGISFDGEVTYQMQKYSTGHYNKVTDALIAKGFAYYCKCSVLELKSMKAHQILTKAKLGYIGVCREQGHSSGVLRLNIKAVVERFGIPRIPIADSLLGARTEDYRNLSDPVLLRGDGTPTYLLANTSDDAFSGVSKIVRGCDLYSQTATQVLLYQAIVGWAPEYCHLPLITDEFGVKLSKRNPLVPSILDYKELGYFPEAIMQFVMSLGNKSVPTDRAIPFKELVEIFDIRKSRASNTGFATHQLKHINRLHIRAMGNDKLVSQLNDNYELAVSEKMVEVFKYRADTLLELSDAISFAITLVKEHLSELKQLALDNFAGSSCKAFRLDVLQGRGTPPLEQLLELVA